MNVVTPLLLEVLRLLEAYVLRRAVCAIPSNSQQKTFATFSRDLQLRNLYKFNKSCSTWLRRLENHQRKEPIAVANDTLSTSFPRIPSCLFPGGRRWARQNASMTARPPAIPLDPRIAAIAAEIRAVVPEAQVRLFGSRARGTAGPDSDVDLLITVPDHCLRSHPRSQLLAAINRRLEAHLLPIDLLLYTESEVKAKRNWCHHVIAKAYQEGRLLNHG